MRKIIYYITATLLPLQLFAQVDKQVEVTKEYIPQVEQREKITLMPEMSVDGSITPDIDYSITPRSIKNNYDVETFAPVEISFWEYTPQSPLYVKLGGGAPASLVGDVYYTHQLDRSYITSYANYDALLGKRRGVDLIKRSSDEQHAKVGSVYRTELSDGGRAFSADILYTIDQWSRYATESQYDSNPLYQSLGLRGGWGDSFTNFDKLNIGFDGEARYLWSRSNYKTGEFSFGTDLEHRVKSSRMHYNADVNYISGSAGYSNLTFGAGVLYKNSSDITTFKVGADVLYDHISADGVPSDGDLRFLPKLQLDIRVKESKFIIDAGVRSELIYNNYASLVERNPFVAPAIFSNQNSVDYSLNGGVKGVVMSDTFEYKLYANYRWREDNIFWAFVVDGVDNYYAIDSSTLHDLNFNLDLSFDPRSNISLRSNLLWRAAVTTPKQSWESGLASFEYQFRAEYSLKKFTLKGEIEILGERETTIISSQSEYVGVIPITYDLGVKLDYRLNRRVNIFCDLNNLLNDDLYRWFGYREYGVGFIVGAQVQF